MQSKPNKIGDIKRFIIFSEGVGNIIFRPRFGQRYGKFDLFFCSNKMTHEDETVDIGDGSTRFEIIRGLEAYFDKTVIKLA